MPEFYTIKARQINEIPHFYLMFARKIIFPDFFEGGAQVAPAPIPMRMNARY